MKFRCRPVVAWALPALLACSAATALPASDRPLKIAEIHLDERLVALGKPRMHVIRVDATSFSPDGSRLAIVFSDGSDAYVLKAGSPLPFGSVRLEPRNHRLLARRHRIQSHLSAAVRWLVSRWRLSWI